LSPGLIDGVWTLLNWKHGYACERDLHSFGGDLDLAHATFHATSANGVHFVLRGERGPWPYAGMVRRSSASPRAAASTGGERALPLAGLLRRTADFFRQSLFCLNGVAVVSVPFSLLMYSLTLCFAGRRLLGGELKKRKGDL
jgi:hypothetical protein